RVLGTGLLAHAAEDAAQHVDLVALRESLAVRTRGGRIVLRGLHVDRVRRAGHRAQLAAHAALEAVGVPGEDVEPAEAREHLELLVRVLDGEGLLEQVLERDAQPLGKLLKHGQVPPLTSGVPCDAATTHTSRGPRALQPAPAGTPAPAGR